MLLCSVYSLYVSTEVDIFPVETYFPLLYKSFNRSDGTIYVWIGNRSTNPLWTLIFVKPVTGTLLRPKYRDISTSFIMMSERQRVRIRDLLNTL